ncbi:MAG TPA: sugar ABC transporter substrate-binding protein [Nitrospira sp.]|mgnify:CR=1 FL=1|nr:sugar ABC transporter substrate-binding protein [Nitrospira sp.]
MASIPPSDQGHHQLELHGAHLGRLLNRGDARGVESWFQHPFALVKTVRVLIGEKGLFMAMACLFTMLVLANVWHQWNRPEATHQKRIAVLLPGSVEFFSIERAAMRETAKAYALDLLFFNAGWDSYQQIHQLEKVLLMSGIEAIALCAVNNEALMAASTLMDNRNLPLVTFTNGIGHDPHGLVNGVQAHVGRDEFKAGQMLGMSIEQLALPHPTRILLIQGSPGTPPQRFRDMGFRTITANHPQWTIVKDVLIPAWDRADVEREVQQALDMKLDFNVIATQWAGAATAAAHTLHNNHVTNVKIVSLEYTRELQKLLIAGTAQSTSNFSVAEEGRQTIVTLAKILNKEAVPKFVEIPQVLLSADDARSVTPEW